ncbi:hypothetical protein D3C87_1343450 [compost metagenome]
MGYGERDVLIGDFTERPVNVAERLRDPPDNVEGGGKCQHEDGGTDGQRPHHLATNLGIQIIDVNAGHDHHLPGLKSKGVGAFGVVIAFHAGLRTVEIRLAAAVAAKPYELVTILEALAVRLALVVLADTLRVGMEFHRHVVVVTEQIAIRGEPHGADGGEGLLHGVFA